MKAFKFVLMVLGFVGLAGVEATAQLLQPELVRSVLSEQLQCRYQLRNEGYSSSMPFMLDVKILQAPGSSVGYLEISLSSVSRFFSALNVSVRSSAGFEAVPGVGGPSGPMMRMQASPETGVNSKAEVMGRTIKLQITDPDGKDWRSVSCLRDGLITLIDLTNQTLR